MFDFRMNVSGIGQSFFDRFGDTISAEPGMAVDFSSVSSHFPEFEKLDKRGIIGWVSDRRAKGFYIHRSFAIGDTLLAVPAVRWVKESLGLEVEMRVAPEMVPLISALGIRAVPISRRFLNGDYGLLMDGVLERDHMDDELGKIHRAIIYLKALGVREEVRELDWSADLSKFPEPEIRRDWPERFVVVAPRGSTPCKTLAAESLEYLICLFRTENIPVVLVGDEVSVSPEEGVIQLWRSKSIMETFHIFSRATAAVVTDSAALWISHFTTTPVVAILGPSRATERTTLHPLDPEGVAVVNAAEAVGCEPCTERGEKCGKSWRCMRENVSWIGKTAFESAMRFFR